MKLDVEKFKLAQARACLSVNDLANKTGIGRVSISRILNGKVKPNPKTVGLMAKALKVDVSEIIL